MTGLSAASPRVIGSTRAGAYRPAHPEKHPAGHFVPRKPVTLMFHRISFDSIRASGPLRSFCHAFDITASHPTFSLPKPQAPYEAKPNRAEELKEHHVLPFRTGGRVQSICHAFDITACHLTSALSKGRMEEGFRPSFCTRGPPFGTWLLEFGSCLCLVPAPLLLRHPA